VANVGRVEQLPKVGSYFTREIAAAGSSIVVVRSAKDKVRAFYNICRHRGNKLVWTDYPREETSGFCRSSQCKYHAWRYNLDGELTFVQQESSSSTSTRRTIGLAPVQATCGRGSSS
jgi:phenylpropionate dioxygenase-like ring-hydroxylating dioxygenase large terminal subunit